MPEAQWPAFANVLSPGSLDPERQHKRFADSLALLNATEADCKIMNVEPTAKWDTMPGLRFRIEFYTYLGWKVYQWHVCGCFASIPAFENNEEQTPATMV
jgi:hypothetical protein